MEYTFCGQDNIVLIDETQAEVNEKVEIWRDIMDSKGFELRRSESEYVECNFNE